MQPLCKEVHSVSLEYVQLTERIRRGRMNDNQLPVLKGLPHRSGIMLALCDSCAYKPKDIQLGDAKKQISMKKML